MDNKELNLREKNFKLVPRYFEVRDLRTVFAHLHFYHFFCMQNLFPEEQMFKDSPEPRQQHSLYTFVFVQVFM